MAALMKLGATQDTHNTAALTRIHELSAQLSELKSRMTAETHAETTKDSQDTASTESGQSRRAEVRARYQTEAKPLMAEMYQLMIGRLEHVAAFIRRFQATYEATLAPMTAAEDLPDAHMLKEIDSAHVHAILGEMLEELDALLAAEVPLEI